MGQRLYEHAGGETCIPNEPQRIVSLHDLTITLALVELNKTDSIVGSHGRQSGVGSPYLRGVDDLFGVDFSNTDIEFVGVLRDIDLEKVATLEPDLIIGRSSFDAEQYDNYERLAPTVLVDLDSEDYFGRLRLIADIAGEIDRYEEEAARYNAAIERTRTIIGSPEDITVSFIFPNARNGTIHVYDDSYAIWQVIEDIGFGMTRLFEDVGASEMDRVYALSTEHFSDIDADFVFSTYDPEREGQRNPEEMREVFEGLVPGFCRFLHACQTGQLIFLERTPLYSGSFRSLDIANSLIRTHVAGRDFTPIPE